MPTLLNPDYRLTIQFSLGGLSFVLFDTEAHMVTDVELHQSENLKNIDELFRTLEKDLRPRDLKSGNCQSVTCLIDGPTTTLVPKELFHDDDLTKLLGFSHTIPAGYLTAAEEVENLQAYNLFAYPQSLHDLILKRWPDAQICHSITVFLKNLPKSETPVVYVNVRNRDFDMAIMQDKLLFFNNFEFKTKVDFCYFILYAMQQQGLSGWETPVWFSGLIQPGSEIIELCRRYLKNIRFVTRPHEFKVKDLLLDVPFQYYYNHYLILK